MDTQKIKRIFSIAGNVLVWIFVALCICITVLVFAAQGDKDGIPSVFGKSLITIETNSMEGTFNRGDLVILTKIPDTEKYELTEGTIITFRTSVDINGDGKVGDINTHRIYAEPTGNSVSYVTKGDHPLARPDNDPSQKTPYTVHPTDIIGVCGGARIPKAGFVIDFLSGSLGFFLCIVLPLILFFLFQVYNFITVLVKERKAAAPAPATSLSEDEAEEIRRRAIEDYIKSQNASSNNEIDEEKKE